MITPNILLTGVCVTNIEKRNLSVVFSIWVLIVFILQGETQKESSNSPLPTLLMLSR